MVLCIASYRSKEKIFKKADEMGIDLSDSRFQALLKRKGYRYRRPKKDLGHLQDKTAKAEAEKRLDELKKRSNETISGSSLWTKQP